VTPEQNKALLEAKTEMENESESPGTPPKKKKKRAGK
jgi:hypothetical protein